MRRIDRIMKEEGVGLYRALPVALARGLPGAVCTLVTYDYCIEYLQRL